jgi:two-component system sensor histidine kinase ResE
MEVADTGAGISSEDLLYIFTRFYQDNPSRTGCKKHGVGLGMAIVKEILTSHGGKIDVLSEPGKGSTFVVNLPLKTP